MSRIKTSIIFIGDVFLLYLGLAITLLIRYGPAEFSLRWNDHFIPFSIIFIIWILTFYVFNLYQYKISRTENLMSIVFLVSVVASLLSITAFYFFPNLFKLTPKANIVIFGFVIFLLKYGWQNLALFKLFTKGLEKIIIVGNSPLIASTVLHIKDNPHIGYSIEAWLDDPEKLGLDGMLKLILLTKARLIVIPNHFTKKLSVSKLIYNLLTHEVNVINFWNFYEIVFDRIPLEELEEGWFVENISTHRPFYDTVKRIFDLVFSAVLLVFFSPIMLFIAFLIKLTSTGPVIYEQKRVGKHNKIFTLYKFRTMYENVGGPLWTDKNDKRITPVGKILRYTHLDELPQFFNIFKGDISLIGPRPERVELALKYKNIPYYDIRHIIKPGLTGWAQINYRPSASIEEAKEKLCYDIYYIKNRSIFLDLLIAFKTVKYLFVNHN